MDNIRYYILLTILILQLIMLLIYINSRIDILNTSTDHTVYDIPFNIKRKTNNTDTVISGVPLVIYQSWHINKVPLNMRETIYKLLDMNPEFDYYLYSDEKSRDFISANYSEEVLTAFDTLKPGAYKSDLWRYCILYKTGGVYLDIKYFSIFPIVEMIKNDPIIFVRDMHLECSFGVPTGIYNAFMVSPPKCKIFINCINEIVENTKFKLYKSGSLDVTGPCLVSRMMKKYDDEVKYENKLYRRLNYKFTRIGLSFETIWYKNRKAFIVYNRYRAEQKAFQKTEHYGKLWDEKNIYNIS